MSDKVCLTRLSNGEIVELNNLSVGELYKLHYDEECFVAEAALQLPPFSNERNQLLQKGYSFVAEVMNFRDIKEFGVARKSFGASQKNAKKLIKLINDKISPPPPQCTVLYEAGVGTGYAIQKILENFNMSDLKIKGCDIDLSFTARQLTNGFQNVELKEGHLYDCIRELPDNSIDIFYADNVLEHFIPDEAQVIYEEISKKLKPHATLFLIIPNRLTGPYDISRRFLPMGEKARGFHFMEMSFNEVTKNFEKHDIHHSYCVFTVPKVGMFMVKSKLIIALKLRFERILAKIPFKFIKKLSFSCGGYSYSILEKG